jgi:drug/metabolite transporter (DMT)-like permease
MTWIALALLSALGGAASNVAMKRAVGHGGVITSTVAYRGIAALMLAVPVLAAGWFDATPAYWRVVALVMPPECAGVLCMMIAFRTGELSEVQPIFGLIPLFVLLGGAAMLREVPTALAGAGVLALASGLYVVGLRAGEPWLEPLRAFARSRASWYALGATLCFSVTSVLHKLGIAEVGPMPWAVTLGAGSSLLLAATLPIVRLRWRALERAADVGPWTRLVLVAAACWAVQQVGLQLALGAANAAYVVSLTATSVVFASALGVLVLREREAAAHRLLGAALVSVGAAMIALGG